MQDQASQTAILNDFQAYTRGRADISENNRNTLIKAIEEILKRINSKNSENANQSSECPAVRDNDDSRRGLATVVSTTSIDSYIRVASDSEDDSVRPARDIQNEQEEQELVINRGNNWEIVNQSHQWNFSDPEVPLTADALLAREEPLTSDELVERYKAYQAEVEDFLKNNSEFFKRNRDSKIELMYSALNQSNSLADNLKIDKENTRSELGKLSDLLQRTENDRCREDQIINDFRIVNKHLSFADKIKHISDIQLNALTNRTVDYIKNALSVSKREERHFRSKVEEIYKQAKESSDQLLLAHILYEYYKLQRSKDKWEKTHPVKKIGKQAYFCLSGLSSKNGRYKREIANMLNAQKQRHDYLAKKYGKESETRGNIHGKERYALEESIQLHQDYIEEDAKKGLPYKRIIKEIEQVRKDLSKQLVTSLNKQERLLIKDNIKRIEIALQAFKDSVQYNSEAIKTRYEIKKKEFERRSGWDRVNDGVSIAGVPLGVLGNVLGFVSLAGCHI
jgi:hypothetical protein